jgi:hypothetical protein
MELCIMEQWITVNRKCASASASRFRICIRICCSNHSLDLHQYPTTSSYQQQHQLSQQHKVLYVATTAAAAPAQPAAAAQGRDQVTVIT